MKLGQLVLQLRNSTDLFPNAIGGAAEYVLARESTLTKEAAFVLPLEEAAGDNLQDTINEQKLTERFAVIVAIKNDTNFPDKTGFTAYNRLHDIRKEMFKAYLGLDIARLYGSDDTISESLIYYRGGQLLDLTRAYMWYQFTFEYYVYIESEQFDTSSLDDFNKIWTDYVLSPDDNLPVEESLPVDLFAPDMTQMINFGEVRQVTVAQLLELAQGGNLQLLDGEAIELVEQ